MENRNDRGWPVNLIWLDANQVVGRSSYYIQKMVAGNRPTYNLKNNKPTPDSTPVDIEAGNIGFGSWETRVEFKDIKVEQSGKTIELDLAQFYDERGDWNINNNVLAQTSLQIGTRRLLKNFSGNDYTLEFNARRTSGLQGFMVYFGMTEDGQTGQVLNIGGWNNQTTSVHIIAGGNLGSMDSNTIKHTLETDRWYNVKLIVTPEKMEFYLDGALMLTYKATTEPHQFVSSGYDETTGELILKVVNAANTPYFTKVKLEGAKSVEKIGKVISLTAKNGEEENSFENPKNIYPQESEYKRFGKEFEYEFPSFSYTILRIKTNF
jgi:alpha-L-arabinofuranosidase